MRRGNSRARKNILLLGGCRAVHLNDYMWKIRVYLEKTFYDPYGNLSTYPRVVQKKKKRKSKRRKREQEEGNKLRPYLACIDGLYPWSRWCVTGRLHHRLTMPGASNIVSWLYQTCQSQHTPGHHLCQKLCSYMTSHARAQPYYLDCLQSAFSLKIRLVLRSFSSTIANPRFSRLAALPLTCSNFAKKNKRLFAVYYYRSAGITAAI